MSGIFKSARIPIEYHKKIERPDSVAWNIIPWIEGDNGPGVTIKFVFKNKNGEYIFNPFYGMELEEDGIHDFVEELLDGLEESKRSMEG